MSNNANGKNETFKPSDYTLEAKKEYVYEYLGLKFKLSDKVKKYMTDKKIAMLDNQSPIDKELKYAILTFEKMTEEQKNAVIEKMGDGYKNWKNELERIGTIGIFEKNTSGMGTITGKECFPYISEEAEKKMHEITEKVMKTIKLKKDNP